MIIAQQMQQAVDKEENEFSFYGMTVLFRLGKDTLAVDEDITQFNAVFILHGILVIQQGKRDHIGNSVLVSIIAVDPFDGDRTALGV